MITLQRIPPGGAPIGELKTRDPRTALDFIDLCDDSDDVTVTINQTFDVDTARALLRAWHRFRLGM